MNNLIHILVLLVAAEHLYFMYFEMFAWETIGKRTFRSLPEHLFTPTRALAANQGLYNGFLAAGLIWSRLIEDVIWNNNIALFFLGCVLIAGIYGAVTASRKIFWVQGVPALIAIIAILYVQRMA